MDVQIVYYKLYSDGAFNTFLDKAKRLSSLSLNEICVSSIEENNKAFLECLEDSKLKGYEHIDSWLKELSDDYVKRKSESKCKGDTPDLQGYYDLWLNNTRLIVNGKYPIIEKWCNEHEVFLKNKMKTNNTTTNPPKSPKSNGAVPKPSPLPPPPRKK